MVTQAAKKPPITPRMVLRPAGPLASMNIASPIWRGVKRERRPKAERGRQKKPMRMGRTCSMGILGDGRDGGVVVFGEGGVL